MSLTTEQFFTAVIKRAEDNPTRCTDMGGQCSYRSYDNNACFIGDFMSDEEFSQAYIDDLETHRAHCVDVGMLVNIDPWLLDYVQSIHDGAPPRYWVDRLKLLKERILNAQNSDGDN